MTIDPANAQSETGRRSIVAAMIGVFTVTLLVLVLMASQSTKEATALHSEKRILTSSCDDTEFDCNGDGTECIPENYYCDGSYEEPMCNAAWTADCSNGADEGLELCGYDSECGTYTSDWPAYSYYTENGLYDSPSYYSYYTENGLYDYPSYYNYYTENGNYDYPSYYSYYTENGSYDVPDYYDYYGGTNYDFDMFFSDEYSNSCVDACGDNVGNCYCDFACQDFGDCCQDYIEVCDNEAESFEFPGYYDYYQYYTEAGGFGYPSFISYYGSYYSYYTIDGGYIFPSYYSYYSYYTENGLYTFDWPSYYQYYTTNGLYDYPSYYSYYSYYTENGMYDNPGYYDYYTFNGAYISDTEQCLGGKGKDSCVKFDCNSLDPTCGDGCESWIGDGWCDDGTWGIDLECPEWDNDGEDCSTYPNP